MCRLELDWPAWGSNRGMACCAIRDSGSLLLRNRCQGTTAVHLTSRPKQSYISACNRPIAAHPVPQQINQVYKSVYLSDIQWLSLSFKYLFCLMLWLFVCLCMCERDKVLTLERLPGSLNKLLDGIAGQVSSGMLSFTVGTCIQTPRQTETDKQRDGETRRQG